MLHRTFTVVKTAFSIFPDTSISLQVLHSTTSPVKFVFIRSFQHMHRLARATQDLHSGENCFLNLSWHLNTPARDSQHLIGAENGFIRSFLHIHRLARASQDIHSAENGFLDPSWHFNKPPRSSQHVLGG